MSSYRPPMPPGFPEAARGKSFKTIRREFKIGAATCERWLTEAGLSDQIRRIDPAKLRPMPSTFPALAAEKSNNWLRIHFKSSDSAIIRWRKECGVPERGGYVRGHGFRPVPDDFAEIAPTRTAYGLEKYYAAGTPTVARWLAETGVKCRKQALPQKGFGTSAPLPAGDVSIAGRAAQHLRSFYPSVYRAEILPPNERRSLPNKGKGFYVVSGKGALPAADLIALAEKRGFDPNAWARL